ncbi:MAG: glycerophosphodiester phosphodiesterase [Caldilineaceae bacterium]|nr:glycerophosphodiester phosphodiesterase [Caldilineaceae bacterium]
MPKRTEVFAHRGAKTIAPENTLPAFEQAIALGADGIELDVQCSRDGVLVVMHNFTVNETTNGQGRVAELTAAQLGKLDAGSHFDAKFSNVSVPTLEEVLVLTSGKIKLNIEVKSQDPMGGSEVEPLVDLIQAGNLYDQVIVSSFNPVTLIKLRAIDPQVTLGLLYAGQHLPAFLREIWLSPILRPEAFHPHHTLIDEEYMLWATAIPAAVNTWTVNDPDEARRLASLGVDTIISDVPDVILAAIA